MKSSPADLPGDFAAALDRVRPRLGPLATSVVYYPSIGSTNDAAASLAIRAEGTVVIADAQTAGRGRRGRSWFSPPGNGLYVSVLLAPSRTVDPARATMLFTLMAAVGLTDGVCSATGLMPAIKWPNDLLVGRRKLSGILAEGIAAGQGAVDPVVLGYGINIGQAAYPPELARRATSLETELGRGVDRALVFAETLAGLARRYDDLLAGRFDVILDAWRARAHGLHGAAVTWTSPSGVRRGVTAGVDDDGALLVNGDGGVERIVSGEVVFEPTGSSCC